MDNLTKEQRKKNMRSIRDRDTKIELKLRKELWRRGYRYRKNYKLLPGKPDIALTKYKIAIFCDSEFFHGKDWENQKERLIRSNNSKYWINKIKYNMEHDKNVEFELKSLGWKVIRFWGKDINRDIEGCIKTVEEAVLDLKMDTMCY